MQFAVIVNNNHTFLVTNVDNQNNAIKKVVEEYDNHRLTIQSIHAYLITQVIETKKDEKKENEKKENEKKNNV